MTRLRSLFRERLFPLSANKFEKAMAIGCASRYPWRTSLTQALHCTAMHEWDVSFCVDAEHSNEWDKFLPLFTFDREITSRLSFIDVYSSDI